MGGQDGQHRVIGKDFTLNIFNMQKSYIFRIFIAENIRTNQDNFNHKLLELIRLLNLSACFSLFSFCCFNSFETLKQTVLGSNENFSNSLW